MNTNQSNKIRFTYGDQFQPEKFSISEIIRLCESCQPNRITLEQEILSRYFVAHSKGSADSKAANDNKRKLAMNCFLSLRAYKLIQNIDDSGSQYELTDISKEILENESNELNTYRIFARHILLNLNGISLLKAIEAIQTRGENPNVELVAYELQEMGYILPPNCTYHSTMCKWLSLAKVINKYDIDWDIVYDLVGTNRDYIDELYTLNSYQKYFLLSMIQLGIDQFKPWNEITKYARSRYQIRFPTKSFVKDVIEPLVQLDLIESQKTTGGRGAKPNLVKLTDKANNELVSYLIKTIADLTEISSIELNRRFEDVISELDNSDKHIKGKALELLAIWMIRLTSLRFTSWRLRSDKSTGGGEVDVLAASDRFVYSRWQIQCKNTKKVDIDVLAKEVGMTFVTGADVIMIVTTGEFTRDAFRYASRMMDVSRYYMILLQREDLEAIMKDKTNIIKILDKQARKVFAKKELQMSDSEIDEIEAEANSFTK